ncbi:MAG TPA: glycoside hydrolase family 36 protein [Terracidiphilus sp.]|nr:glycoside hydrolase family 36 protein [Terracidiphilus sp.]
MRLCLENGAAGPRVATIEAGKGRYENTAAEALPTNVEIDGKTVAVKWKLVPGSGSADKKRVSLMYESAEPHLRLEWVWEARADSGAMEHFITVENLGAEETWLPMIDSLRLGIRYGANTAIDQLYVEKGANTPSDVGTHLNTVKNGYRWTGKSSTYALPTPGEPREIIPGEFVFEHDGKQRGWFAGIEFSGRTRISLERKGDTVSTVLGLNPEPGPFRTRLSAGGSFTTPTVFLGVFTGGSDGAANQLRPWVRSVLGNPRTWKDPQYPLLVNNSWGSGMQVDEKLALRMIADSKELGLEMFHIDAGWFRGVGDWYPSPQKFPHGLAPIADEAHKQGLRFGIWVDWTQAGLDTEPGALNVNDPKVHDWLVTDLPPDWKPEEFKGQTVDVGVPAAHDYLLREVNRMVDDYHLDMIEHDGYLVAKGCMRNDHPHAPLNRSTLKVEHDWGSYFVVASNSTDVSYHAVRAYYDIYENTRRRHPGLLFEICNDGGRMVDFGTAAHGDYFSITDTYDPLSNRRAFYDTSYMLPAAMLESYVEKWPVPRPENFLYMLRSGMMGWLTIMTDTTAWTAEQHETARQEFELFKEQLRPLIRDAQLYHISARPDGLHWDGMEYWDPSRRKGVVYAFRGKVSDEDHHIFVLHGLNPASTYKLHFQDGTAADVSMKGNRLMESGLQVHLEHPLSSELVFIKEAGRSRDGR